MQTFGHRRKKPWHVVYRRQADLLLLEQAAISYVAFREWQARFHHGPVYAGRELSGPWAPLAAKSCRKLLPKPYYRCLAFDR